MSKGHFHEVRNVPVPLEPDAIAPALEALAQRLAEGLGASSWALEPAGLVHLRADDEAQAAWLAQASLQPRGLVIVSADADGTTITAALTPGWLPVREPTRLTYALLAGACLAGVAVGWMSGRILVGVATVAALVAAQLAAGMLVDEARWRRSALRETCDALTVERWSELVDEAIAATLAR